GMQLLLALVMVYAKSGSESGAVRLMRGTPLPYPRMLPHTCFSAPALVGTARTSSGGCMSILLAEGNPTHRHFARQLLDQHFPDYGPVLEVTDGSAVVQRALTERPG